MKVSPAHKKKRRNRQSDRCAKVHQLYSSDDVIKLYEISRNTLTNWIGDGLPFINAEPRLFRGSDLNAFHGRRNAKNKAQLPGPFAARCFGCKRTHALTDGDILVVAGRSTGVFRVSRLCPDTGKQANRYISSGELEALKKARETNTGSKTPD